MTTKVRDSTIGLRRRHLAGDPYAKLVENSRRYRIHCQPDSDPVAIWASTQSTQTGRVVLVGGEFALEAGPFSVVAKYDLDEDTTPHAAHLWCRTCGWWGPTRTWRYRRLMIGDAAHHTCGEDS